MHIRTLILVWTLIINFFDNDQLTTLSLNYRAEKEQCKSCLFCKWSKKAEEYASDDISSWNRLLRHHQIPEVAPTLCFLHTHKTRLKPKLTDNINCTDLPCCLLQERHVWVTQYKTYLMLNAENSCAAQSFSGNWYILFNSNFVAIAKNTLYGSIKNYQFFFYSKNH